MKALTFQGKTNLTVEEVLKPVIIDPKDIILKITASAICGSDLHLYSNLIPSLEKGDILGHEFMGIVEEKGSAVTHVEVGDKVIIPFCIACGECIYCKEEKYSLCENSNPNKSMCAEMFGYPLAALYGYTHLFGGIPGGQAEYVRVPYATFNAFKVPADIPDEKLLFLTDIFPTGYMAAENCEIKEGDVVAVWGAGPVGQFAIRSAYMLGASKVVAIDRIPERLKMAEDGGAIAINYEEEKSVYEILKRITNGEGPNSCIDAVGMEAHSGGSSMKGLIEIYDDIKQELSLETDRPEVLREIIYSCRKGGMVSVAGVYAGLIDKYPMGIAFNKSLNFKMGQTHVHKYVPLLLQKIIDGEIDPSFVITHKVKIEDVPKMYEVFQKKQDGCIKVVIKFDEQ